MLLFLKVTFLTVNYGVLAYKLKVLELKPSSTVSVLENIVDPYTASEETDQHLLIRLVVGMSQIGTVDEGKFVYYKFSIDNGTWDKISTGNSSVEHEWSSHDIGSKTSIISSKDKNLGPGTYSLGIYGFKGMTRDKILVMIQDNFNQKLGPQASSSMSSTEMDAEQCRNCKHYITYPLGPLHCMKLTVAGIMLSVSMQANAFILFELDYQTLLSRQ